MLPDPHRLFLAIVLCANIAVFLCILIVLVRTYGAFPILLLCLFSGAVFVTYNLLKRIDER